MLVFRLLGLMCMRLLHRGLRHLRLLLRGRGGKRLRRRVETRYWKGSDLNLEEGERIVSSSSLKMVEQLKRHQSD